MALQIFFLYNLLNYVNIFYYLYAGINGDKNFFKSQ